MLLSACERETEGALHRLVACASYYSVDSGIGILHIWADDIAPVLGSPHVLCLVTHRKSVAGQPLKHQLLVISCGCDRMP